MKKQDLLKITSQFDSGNIEVVAINAADDIQLKICPDGDKRTQNWFYFRLIGAKDVSCKMKILNAGESAKAEAWYGYMACASYDRQTWFRIQTSFENGILTIEDTPRFNSVFYAYFAPYTYEQHLDLVNAAQLSEHCDLISAGTTVKGNNIDCLVVGKTNQSKKNIWITARQHAGETMTAWFVQGLLSRLLDSDDPVGRQLLQKFVFYVIPNVNIDGSIAGYMKTNSVGVDLNRAWENPNTIKSPEVFHILNLMEEKGVDMYIDVHGEEDLPFNFISDIDGIPDYTDKQETIINKLKMNWQTIYPDFQTKFGYSTDKQGEAGLKSAARQVGQKFHCISFMLKMPFKDNHDLSDPIFGWSPVRSEKLGASMLDAIYSVTDELLK